MDIVANMEALARKWHDGKFRKDGKTPYYEHPKAVVEQLRAWGYDEPVTLAVAWGHDLMEDTEVPAREVAMACGSFGPEVLSGIAWLTFLSGEKDRKGAKAKYISHIADCAPPEILAVKIADRLCNLRDFKKLYGGPSQKFREYWHEAEPLYGAMDRLPEEPRRKIMGTMAEVGA